MKTITIIFLFSWIYLSLSKYIQYPIVRWANKLHLFAIISDKKYQQYYELILSNNINWSSPQFHVSLSNSTVLIERDKTIQYDSDTIWLDLYKDNIELILKSPSKFNEGSTKIKFPNIYFLNNSRNIIKGFDKISFASRYDDIRFSLVHQWYSAQIIDKLSFTYTYDSLYFGNSPSELYLNTNQTKCFNNRQSHNVGWGCAWHSIGFLNKTYLNENKYSNFEFNYGYLLVPFSFWNILYDEYFKQAIELKQCWNSYNETYFCFYQGAKLFPEITLNFDGFKFVLTNDLLFAKTSTSNWWSRIKLNKKFDEWSIGVDIIDKLMLTFDWEDDSITWYNYKNNTSALWYSNWREDYRKDRYSYNITFLLFAVWIIGWGYEMAIYIKVKNKKN